MFPEGTPTVTLTGTLPGAAVGTPFAGRVVLTPSAVLIDADRNVIYAGGGRVDLDEDGAFTVELLPNNADGIEPDGWKWEVDVQPLRGRRITFWADIHGAGGATIHLADLVPIPAPGGGPGPRPAGESAYQVAVDEGFDGTVTEWLTSLIGPAGSDGADGQDGATGAQGPQGTQGVAGSTGSTGPKGDQGDDGPEGPQGDAGPTGATGAKGDTGNAGPQGATGATGSQPPLGAAGAGATIALRSNDPTTTNARTPTAHASTHVAAGADPVTLTQAQITGLTAALAALAQLAGADFTGPLKVIGDDLTVQREDGEGAYRLRVTGGGLDFEVGGMDVIVSLWTEPDFTGTQTAMMRWEPAGPHLIGRVQIGTNPYDAVFDLDAAGGKAGFFGAPAVPRQPVSGSWADGTAGASLAAAMAALGLIADTTTP